MNVFCLFPLSRNSTCCTLAICIGRKKFLNLIVIPLITLTSKTSLVVKVNCQLEIRTTKNKRKHVGFFVSMHASGSRCMCLLFTCRFLCFFGMYSMLAITVLYDSQMGLLPLHVGDTTGYRSRWVGFLQAANNGVGLINNWRLFIVRLN